MIWEFDLLCSGDLNEAHVREENAAYVNDKYGPTESECTIRVTGKDLEIVFGNHGLDQVIPFTRSVNQARGQEFPMHSTLKTLH